LVDVEAIDCQRDASWEADIIVIAVPDNSLKELTDRIKDVAIGKIVISLSGFAENNDRFFWPQPTGIAWRRIAALVT
jgi:predicted dinucleotide-binding enzyme